MWGEDMAQDNKYYDGNRVINTLDLDKQKPAIVMIAGNRTAGKTFWCKQYVVKKFLKRGSKFIILQRFGYQLKGFADTFMKDLKQVIPEYADYEMKENVIVKDCIYELKLNDNVCGYSVALNNADNIKRNSTLFVDVDYIFLDEFQSETNKYCPDEVQKFISIYTSVARGKGEQSRHVTALLCSNNVTPLNPYYTALGVGSRIQKDTKILRGHGWVLEITFNENASQAMMNSGIGRAFAEHTYMKYSAQNIYLNDSNTFIEKLPAGIKPRIECVLKYHDETYGMWNCGQFLYISTKYDPSCKYLFALDIHDHNAQSMLIGHGFQYRMWRDLFDSGLFRFRNLKCKQILFDFLGYI